MNEYMKERYRKRRNEAIERLGGCCVNCGSDKDLEFDHKDPETKSFTIAHASSFSEKRWNEELVKCQLLCKDCHREKSKHDGSADNFERETHCACGKVLQTTKQYAGHRTWCKLNKGV